MKGILSFEMIRAGTDALIDAGIPEHVTQAVFDAIHAAAEPHIVGKQVGPLRRKLPFLPMTADEDGKLSFN